MKCKDIAKYISQELVNKGFIVHRYDSYSTCSIYLIGSTMYFVIPINRTNNHFIIPFCSSVKIS